MMDCPICKTVPLRERSAFFDTPLWFCDACHGHWMGGDYVAEGRDAAAPPESQRLRPNLVETRHAAVLCPHDGNLMLQYRVVRGAEFYIDRCPHCDGLWLDRHEWDMLRCHDLRSEIGDLCNGWWEDPLHQLRETHRLGTQAEETLRAVLTEAEYCQVDELRSWLHRHPQRREVIGSLLADEEEPAFSGRLSLAGG